MNTEDRLRILKMIEEGKISASEGAILLQGNEPANKDQPVINQAAAGSGPRFIHVMVTDTSSGKPRVNIKLPVTLVSTGLKMGAHLSTEMEAINSQQISEYIKRGITGQVLDVVDDEEDERVQIFLE